MHNCVCPFELNHAVCVLNDYGAERGFNLALATGLFAHVKDRHQAYASRENRNDQNHGV